MKKVKIVVIDDEKDFTMLLKLNLEETGLYEVFVMNEGAEALKTIKRVNPEIVLLDIIMPDLDGFKVLELIKNDPQINTVSVMMLTALDTLEDREKAQRLYNECYLVKPTPLDVLVEEIEKVVKRRTQAGLS
ncbi:MAG: response regulator [Candidatus Omnitrophica bacterium]|nr:response regulator [Candidatus Omnitrophota bacterium]